MAKPRESKRFIWVTWLIKLLSGDDWCEWRAATTLLDLEQLAKSEEPPSGRSRSRHERG